MADRPIINHAEMVFRPGDREAARALFQKLGFRVGEIEGFPWLAIDVDHEAPEGELRVDNVMYANESTPAQQNLEAALQQKLDDDPEFANLFKRYMDIRFERPQYHFHYGASVPTHEDWKRRVDDLAEANESHPELKGRLHLSAREPGDPGALGGLSQLFVYTDIICCGPHPFGPMLFDLQWSPGTERLLETMPTSFPDRLQMI
jgi:hypothetical protein